MEWLKKILMMLGFIKDPKKGNTSEGSILPNINTEKEKEKEGFDGKKGAGGDW